jgi:YVTN family beta-propeller protein
MFMKAKARIILGLIFILFFAVSAFCTVHSIGIIGSPINVGEAPLGLAYDSSKGEIFVANSGSGTVSVISDSNDTVIHTITLPAGSYPEGVAYDSGRGEIIVTDFSNWAVYVINDTDYSVVKTLSIELPIGVCYDSGKGEIFVTSVGTSLVYVINDTTDKQITTVDVGFWPHGLAYDSAMGEIFVAEENSVQGAGSVAVINDTTNSVVASVTMNNNPWKLAYDSGKGEIFVSSYTGTGSDVWVISDGTNAAANTVIDTIPLPNGNGGYDFAYDSGKGEVFLSNAGASKVYAISDTTNAVVGSVTLPVLSGPVPLAYDPAMSEIFVGDQGSNQVSILSDSPPLAPPAISMSLGTVDKGGNSTLSVSTDITGGVSPFSYQWYENSGSGYSPVGSATASAASFVFETAPVAPGTYQFELKVTDSESPAVTVTSNVVQVTVDAALIAPTVEATPGTVDQGQTSSLTMTAAASAGTPTYTYQWFQIAPNGVSSMVGSGSNPYSFVTTGSTATGSWSFILQATDSIGTAVNSTAASVTVNPALVAPTVSASPGTVDKGQSSTLSVITDATGGTSPFSYQWYENSGSGYSAVGSSASSAASYVFDTASIAAGTYQFELQVTDSAGSPVTVISNVVSVTVNSALVAPTVTPNPSTVTQGSTSSLTSTTVTTGTPSYTYQWFEQAPSGSYVTVGTDSTSFSFTTSTSTTTGAWNFKLQVTDSAGAAVDSIVASVTVNAPAATPTPAPTAAPTSAPTTAPTQAATPTPTPTPTPSHKPVVTASPTVPPVSAPVKVPSWIIYIVIVIVVVAAILIVLLLLSKSRKKKIVASAGPNGKISPDGTVKVDVGADQAFAIMADPHYHVADVMVDGKSVGPQTSYTFKDVKDDHTINATFKSD